MTGCRIITGTVAAAGATLAGASITVDGHLATATRLYLAGILILIVSATGFLSRLVSMSTNALEMIRQAGYDDGYADGLEVGTPTVRRLSAVGDGSTAGRSAAQ